MFLRAVAFALTIPAASASGQTITFQSDTDIKVIRILEPLPGMVKAELLGTRDGRILCVAINRNGEPIAVTTSLVDIGYATFDNLTARNVAQVACQYQ